METGRLSSALNAESSHFWKRRPKGIGLAGVRVVIRKSPSGMPLNSFITIIAMLGRQFAPWQ
jgi:hypothetical protein